MNQNSIAPSITPAVSNDDVESICNHAVWLRSIYRHYQILFEGTDIQRELLHGTAPTFIGDLNHLLIENLILQVCKITDPERSLGKTNLTAEFLVNNSDFADSPGELGKLKYFRDRMQSFRKKIALARNKLISHLDRDSVLDGIALGGVDKSEWDEFWIDLQGFLEILHKHYIDPRGHFYLNAIGYLSDADNLVKALKESTYFRTLLDDKDLTRRCSDVAFNSKFFDA